MPSVTNITNAQPGDKQNTRKKQQTVLCDAHIQNTKRKKKKILQHLTLWPSSSPPAKLYSDRRHLFTLSPCLYDSMLFFFLRLHVRVERVFMRQLQHLLFLPLSEFSLLSFFVHFFALFL